MNDYSLARLEAHIERLVEGTFAQLFGKTASAREMAVYLARAMQANITPAQGEDPCPLAPEEYSIFLAPQQRQALLAQQPQLETLLCKHIAEMADIAGCRLDHPPIVRLLADNTLTNGEVRVQAGYQGKSRSATGVLERVANPTASTPSNAHLLVNGEDTIWLEQPMVQIGRSRENDIVLEDPFSSRHHAQLRLRFGRYTLFDSNSQSGTFVNNVRVREHVLQVGDVIRIGNTHLLYFDENAPEQNTEPLSPLE